MRLVIYLWDEVEQRWSFASETAIKLMNFNDYQVFRVDTESGEVALYLYSQYDSTFTQELGEKALAA